MKYLILEKYEKYFQSSSGKKIRMEQMNIKF
jgi:hypothetical protein